MNSKFTGLKPMVAQLKLCLSSVLRLLINMQNKPNLVRLRRIANDVLTKDYENIANCKLCKNKPKTKPKQTQSKPISNFLLGMSYEENYVL